VAQVRGARVSRCRFCTAAYDRAGGIRAGRRNAECEIRRRIERKTMGVKKSRPPGKEGLEPDLAAGVNSASDALRQEAERDWAESDRKAAKGRRRTRVGAKRRGEAQARDAEIELLKRKLGKRQSGRRHGGKAK
jgi:hypothetical protein